MSLEQALDTYRATLWRKEGQLLGTRTVKNVSRHILVSRFSLVDTFVKTLFHRVPSTPSWELWRSCEWSQINIEEGRDATSRLTADLRSPAKVVVG